MAKNLVQLCSKYRILVYIRMYHHKTYAYVSWILLRSINLMAAKNLLERWIQSKNSYSRLYVSS